ncbi:MAG: uroporphyrinogen decarboxylase family protein, partial [bacterium]
RVPVDYWAVPEVNEILLKKLGIEKENDLLNRLEVDVRYVKPSYAGSDFKEQPDGSLHRKLSDGTLIDIWGVKRKKVNWGRGTYLEVIESPLTDANCVKEIEDNTWPSVEDFDYQSISRQCSKYKDLAIILTGDRLTTRASVFKLAMYLRGMDKFLMDLVLNPMLVEALVAKLLEFHLEHNRRIFEAAAKEIDVFMLGDDFGSENGLLISLPMFLKFFKPALRCLIDLAKKFNLKTMLHSCGGIRELIPDFIEMGLDILNPIQIRAQDMDPKELKRQFGRDICFHGSIDIQKELPFRTPDEIRNIVRSRINILGENGGFILAPSHNLQPDIPVDNIIAMYTTARDVPGTE